jgi:Na+-translocating ferredoxin:NAD+ oxidoreductase subunit G
MTSEAMQHGYLRQAWLVIVLAFAYGGALAGVHISLAPRIAENRRQETYSVIPLLIDGADQERTVELYVEEADGSLTRVYQTHDAVGNHNGWVLAASGQGFAGDIELLVGLDTSLSTITGMYVLDQKETPGLGDYIRDSQFQAQFRDLPADTPLEAVKSDPQASHQIVALSGATVSSLSVCEIINNAVARLREPIQRQQATVVPEAEPTGEVHTEL